MSTPTKTSVEMPAQAMTEAARPAAEAKDALHQALSDAESLGHPLCGPTARADARRSRVEAFELIDHLASLASQPAVAVREPLTTAAVFEVRPWKLANARTAYLDGVRFAERWHGIPARGQQEGGQ